MLESTIEKLNEMYRDTATRCGGFLHDASDEEIAYNLFEEFDIGVISFFYEKNLEILLSAGFITEWHVSKSLAIRRFVETIQANNEWTLNHFRKGTGDWQNLLSYCDELSDSIRSAPR